jgi:hypothetical protein
VVLFEALRQRMRDAAPPVVERRPPAPRAEAIDMIEEQDELPEGEDVVPVGDEADELVEEDATDLMRDEDAPTGDEVRGDDRDVEELAEATPDEHAEVDTDAMDALAATPSISGEDEKPPVKRATKRTSKTAAAKKTTAARKTTRKKAE